MNIALEIKLEAVRRNLPLQSLAEAIGTYPERFSRALNGSRPLDTESAVKAAEVLKIPLSELVRRAEEAAKRKQQEQQQEGDTK